MPIKVTCSNCGGVLHAPDDAAGKKGRCPTCGTVLTIPSEADVPSPTPMTAPISTPPRPVPEPPTPGSAFGPRPPVAPYGLAPASEVARSPSVGSSLAGGPAPNRLGPPPAAVGSKLPPDPRRYSTDPYTGTNAVPAPRRTLADADRWRRVAGGLRWVQWAAVFAFLGLIGVAGLPIAEAYGVTLPDRTPGYLGMPDLSSATEIRLGAALVPLALGVLLLAFGRMGVSAAPAGSFAGGPAKAAGFATLILLAAVTAVSAMTALGMKEGYTPTWRTKPSDINLQAKAGTLINGALIHSDELPGVVQRFGLVTALTFGLMAEVWYVAALGRMGASLQNRRATGRVSRFLLLVGLVVIGAALAATAAELYGTGWVQENVLARWEALEPPQRVATSGGAVLLAGFVFLLIYIRLAGGVRGAIREYLDSTPGV